MTQPRPETPAAGEPGDPTTRIAIAAFTGFNDAAEASSGVIAHLRKHWAVRPAGSISSEDYSDCQVNRPLLVIADDGTRSIEWPDTALEIISPPSGPALLALSGPEPSFRWRAYIDEVIGVLREHGVRELITLGSLLADAPHSRPLPVARWEHSADGRRDDAADDAYEGPIGIPTALGHAAHAAGIEVVALWGQVPHYVAQTPSPKAVLALIHALQDHLPSATIPLGDLETEAEAWQRGVDELAKADPEIADYVRRLEDARDTAELPDATGDAIAREFERFLRRRREE